MISSLSQWFSKYSPPKILISGVLPKCLEIITPFLTRKTLNKLKINFSQTHQRIEVTGKLPPKKQERPANVGSHSLGGVQRLEPVMGRNLHGNSQIDRG